MAKKKFYAVKTGHKTGIFLTWEECKKAVEGKSGAEYKSFSTIKEANAYLEGSAVSGSDEIIPALPPGKVIVYVDGSYEDSIKRYAFGCVIITPTGEIIKKNGNGNNPASLAIRNVAGEMIGAMFAAKWALVNGYSEVEIRYDYEGIEKWVTGVWKTKNELTVKYAEFMRNLNRSIRIVFTKVAAHSNNKYNDMADELAKLGLVEGNGIPEITVHSSI